MLGLVLVACQNSPKNPTENAPANQAPLPAAPALASADEIQKATATISSNLQVLEDLRKKIDALPSNVRKEKSAQIEGYYNEIEGMMAKQTKMLSDLKGASMSGKEASTASEDSPGLGGLNTALLKDYNESAARYSKTTQEILDAIEKN